MTGWLIALAIIVLLAILPLGVSACYDAEGAVVRVIVGFLKFKVFPAKKKEEKPKKTSPKDLRQRLEDTAKRMMDTLRARLRGEEPPPAETEQIETKEEPAKAVKKKKKESKENNSKLPGGKLTDFMPMVQIVLDLLDDFRWKLRVDRLYVKVILAGDDPCDLAVNYGKAWAAVGNLFPALERSCVIKKRDVEIECDFTADQTLIDAQLDLTITLGRLIALCGVHGVRGLREFIKILKLRKGGASK